MRTIVQIAPQIEHGTGVAGVAANLEREWQQLGLTTERFTMTQAHGDWLPSPSGGLAGKLAHVLHVVWFSTVGTVLARRALATRRDVITICHNDALFGDVYVNHGNVHAAMEARGGRWWRTIRNPLHLFTGVRDAHRYRSRGTHRAVVNLVARERHDLQRIYRRVTPHSTVIGNGVDTQRFVPPTDAERGEARARLGIDEQDLVVLFIGHEYDRKGLPLVLRSMVEAPPHWHLVVVGGTADMVRDLRDSSPGRALGSRLHTTGAVTDPRPLLRASDLLASPSAYESYGLVVLEALACGVPVVATATGCVPDVIEQGRNGFIVEPTVEDLRAALLQVDEGDRSAMRDAARETALHHTWESVALQYLELFDRVRPVAGGWGPS